MRCSARRPATCRTRRDGLTGCSARASTRSRAGRARFSATSSASASWAFPRVERCTGGASPRALTGELAAQDLVDHLGIALAAHRFHNRADEKSVKLVAAGAVLGELGAFRRKHPIAGLSDFSFT